MKKTLIFDVGDVVIKTTPNLHYKKLANLVNIDWNKVKFLIENSGVISNFEGGLIDKKEFIKKINNLLNSKLCKKTIEHIWDSVLADVNIDLLNFINTLDLDIVFASNTNILHWKLIYQILNFYLNREFGIFLSFREKVRKPNLKFYKNLLNKFKLQAMNAVFIDDSLTNVNAAKKLGINIIHFKNIDSLKENFKKLMS